MASKQASHINRKGKAFRRHQEGAAELGSVPNVGVLGLGIFGADASWKEQGGREVSLSVLGVEAWKVPLRRREHQNKVQNPGLHPFSCVTEFLSLGSSQSSRLWVVLA